LSALEHKTATRRGRPREFDEGQLLERARALFWSQGFAATSLGAIAEATGVHKPSLYAAYGDKTKLFLATLARYRAEAGTLIADALGREPLRAALKAFFAADITLFAGSGPRGCYAIGVAEPAGREEGEIALAARDAWERLEKTIAARVARAPARELPVGMSAPAVADLVMAVHLTLATRARAGDLPRSLTVRANTLIRLLP
jgi:AcrR family transcriptional regulator